MFNWCWFPLWALLKLIYRSVHACLSFSHSLQLLRLQAHAFPNVLLLPCSRPALVPVPVHTHTLTRWVRFCDFHFHFPRSCCTRCSIHLVYFPCANSFGFFFRCMYTLVSLSLSLSICLTVSLLFVALFLFSLRFSCAFIRPFLFSFLFSFQPLSEFNSNSAYFVSRWFFAHIFGQRQQQVDVFPLHTHTLLSSLTHTHTHAREIKHMFLCAKCWVLRSVYKVIRFAFILCVKNAAKGDELRLTAQFMFLMYFMCVCVCKKDVCVLLTN